jgi:NAD(P)H-hydrate epimerase
VPTGILPFQFFAIFPPAPTLYHVADMQVLTSEEMRATDRRTIEQHGIPSRALMERAGSAVASFALQHFQLARRITVMAGGGNNGGDGLVAARMLAAAGRAVTVLMLAARDRLSEDCAVMLEELGQEAIFCSTPAELAAHRDKISSADLIVDALLGTGFKPPLRELAAAAIAMVAATDAPVLAVDLPSGWDADSTQQATGPAMPADAVLTFTSPKTAHVYGMLTRRWTDPIAVVPIGSPAEAIQSARRLHWAGGSLAIAQKPRRIDANKGSFGHVLVLGGSPGKIGAPVMASIAALRSGAGLVTLAVPESQRVLAAGFHPELMTYGLRESRVGTINERNLEDLSPLIQGKTVLALGPGMGVDDETTAFVEGVCSHTSLPLVLDADALNVLAKRPRVLNAAAKRSSLVLTPHPGEMARLTGFSVAEVQADREGVAGRFAIDHNCILVLKGWRTIVAHPSGEVAVNTTGNPAMAKGGSGDTLTGLIAGLLAQHPEQPGAAVEAAVCLHGLAADFATRAGDEHTALATDVLEHLFCAFRYQTLTKGGYVYLQGAAQAASQPESRRGSRP